MGELISLDGLQMVTLIGEVKMLVVRRSDRLRSCSCGEGGVRLYGDDDRVNFYGPVGGLTVHRIIFTCTLS